MPEPPYNTRELSEQESPDGETDRVNVTLSEKPPLGMTVIVTSLVTPTGTATLAGKDRTKSVPRTVTDMMMEWKSRPLDPLKMTVYDPGTVELTLNVAVPDPVMRLGWMDAFRLNVAMADRLTWPVKPFNAATVTVDVSALVVLTVSAYDSADIEKSGPVTSMETNSVCVSVLLTPVTTTA